MEFQIKFSGHKNIRSNHQKTIEITQDSELTIQGDCIVGLNATSSCSKLPLELKKILCSNSEITFVIAVNGQEFTVNGYGHPDLILSHPTDIVIRKSNFICPRTLAIRCDAASDQIPRDMIQALQDPSTMGTLTIKTK